MNFIRSITMDQWIQEQVNIIKVGGKSKIRNFLTTYNMPEDVGKKKFIVLN